MNCVNLDRVNRTHLPIAGGKGANLGEPAASRLSCSAGILHYDFCL